MGIIPIMKPLDRVLAEIDSSEGNMVQTMIEMIGIPAVAPESGGLGEERKADYLMPKLAGFDEVVRIDVPDNFDPSIMRPNILARKIGKKDGTVWIVAHMDVVPAGDPSKWDNPPFEPILKDGSIYGRGTEDNGQALISSLFAALPYLGEELGGMSIGLAYVSDEETTSLMGIGYLIDHGYFSHDDVVVVPDWGSPGGSKIWLSEKSLVWVKFDVVGRSVHGSTPHKGLNAFRASAYFMADLIDTLESRFSERNELFSPPFSTFEPTKSSATVENVNTIPGTHSFCIDVRLLPTYSIDDVMDVCREVAKRHEKDGLRIIVTELQRNVSGSVSSPDSIGFKALSDAVETITGSRPAPAGTGAATCANFFRLADFDAYVWQCGGGTLHEPNEHVVISNLMTDCKVFATLFHSLCLKGEDGDQTGE